MEKCLAIIAPKIGCRSETFIRRHMQEIMPGKTVVVTAVNSTEDDDWSVDCPVLVSNWLHKGGYRERSFKLASQAVQVVTQNFGWKPAERNWLSMKKVAKEFLKQNEVEVIMGEYLDLSFPWIEVAEELNIRFFGHAHGYDISCKLQNAKWRRRYLRYNELGGVITISEASRKKLLELGLNPNKLHVVPCGVDVPTNPFVRHPKSTIQCLSVGRMVAKKAPLKTLESFRRATATCPELRLDYVGDGELLSRAKQYVSLHNLDSKVTFHGSQPNKVVHQLMRKADIFVQHSVTDPITQNEEGLPVAILESMAHGLPVVSTRHAGIPEAVIEGKTGYLVDEGDSSRMADSINVLASDFHRRQSMGEAGRKRAKCLYSIEREREELIRILGLKP